MYPLIIYNIYTTYSADRFRHQDLNLNLMTYHYRNAEESKYASGERRIIIIGSANVNAKANTLKTLDYFLLKTSTDYL